MSEMDCRERGGPSSASRARWTTKREEGARKELPGGGGPPRMNGGTQQGAAKNEGGPLRTKEVAENERGLSGGR